ncbi:insulinase family protein [Paraglaciecola sp.]|uniref:insulinase family protein n=1 Tax=Paraglaciecola sp. TaxID=1920173 RepID=UPI003264FC1F
MLKSAYDKRQYKFIELPNGLKFLLVQDPLANKSACSITVNAGHFNDDNDCPGISHLLEHMLFLGNDKFPNANDFSNFLASHNGSINASTGSEFTSFFYDLNSDIQTEDNALEHLSAMMLQPIFDETLIEKEINAIDAEFSLKQKDDLRRLYQVHKETCNPDHPFSKFSVGNLETFSAFSAIELKEKIQRFHQSYYQPQNTSLCIISKQSITSSEQLVRKHFGPWDAKKLTSTDKHPSLYLPEHLGIQMSIKPIQQAQRMIFTFPLPGQREYFRSKPLSVLSHILGDEGDGGLLSFYKQKNWATSLSAGGGIEGSSFKDFNINLQLTSEGIKNQDNIILALFAFIQLIKEEGVSSWRIQEISTLNQLMWDFTDHAKPIDEAQELSIAIFEYPEEYLLCGDYILDKPSPALTLQMLDYFSPENLRLKVVTPDASTKLIAKWYNTPYDVTNLNLNFDLNMFKSRDMANLKLPDVNKFIQPLSKLNDINHDYHLPQKIVSETGLHIWYGQDDKFKQPKGHCFLTFDCPVVNQGIEIVAGKRLWIALLNERLNQKYYQANMAGIHFHFYPHQGGFSIQTSGFSNPQLEFCSNLLTEIIVHDNFENSFLQVKHKQLNGLSNTLLNKPINRMFSRLAVLMQQQNYSPEQMAFNVNQLALHDIKTTKEQLLSSFHLEGLMYGDWAYSDTIKVVKDVKSFRNAYPTADKINRGVADIRKQATQIHQVNCEHPDSAVVLYFQAPDSSIKTTVLTILAEQLLATPFFHKLRTTQQLGYLVGTGYVPYNNHPGISFYIQSPHKSVSHLIEAINTFLIATLEDIREYQNVWKMLKNGVIKQLMQKDTNLNMKSQHLWMAIGNGNLTFNHNEKMVESIIELELSDLNNYLQDMVSRQNFGEFLLYSGDLSDYPATINTANVSNIQRFKSEINYL